MSLFSRGIVAAMEDEAANQELAIDDAGADSMEADLVEAVDLAANIDRGTDEMEQTVKDADQLERHVEVLTDAEGEGGATPELVESTEIAVEAIFERLGIYSGTGIPALESFSTKAGRARNTRVAIEEISDKIKKVWEAVVNAFKRLVNYVKDFFGKMFDANKKMLSRVIALRGKAKQIKGVAKDKVKGSGISNVIDVKEINSFKSSNISDSVKMATSILKNTSELVDGVKSQEAFEKARLVMGIYSRGSDAKAAASEGMVWKVAFEIAGNKIIHLIPKSDASGKDAYEKAAKYSVKTEKSDKGDSGDVTPLTSEQIGKVLDGVEQTVKALMDQKSQIASVQSAMDSTIHTIQSIASSTSKDDEGGGDRSTKARSAVTALGNGAIKIITLVGAEVTRSSQAALTYVERSIDAYSEDNKKKEEGK